MNICEIIRQTRCQVTMSRSADVPSESHAPSGSAYYTSSEDEPTKTTVTEGIPAKSYPTDGESLSNGSWDPVTTTTETSTVLATETDEYGSTTTSEESGTSTQEPDSPPTTGAAMVLTPDLQVAICGAAALLAGFAI